MDGMLFFKQNSLLSTDSVKWYRFVGCLLYVNPLILFKTLLLKTLHM